MIYSIFFSYSTNKIESPCANLRYTQCLKSFSYFLTAVNKKKSTPQRQIGCVGSSLDGDLLLGFLHSHFGRG